jgi:hypothetical protein
MSSVDSLCFDPVADVYDDTRTGLTRLVPQAIHLKVVRKLKRELLKEYGTLDTEVAVPNQMRLLLINGQFPFPK